MLEAEPTTFCVGTQTHSGAAGQKRLQIAKLFQALYL